MNSKRCTLLTCLFIAGLLCLPTVAWAPSDECHGASNLHAKGFNTLKISLARDGELKGLSLEFSFDGQTFYPANVGLARGWHLFKSVIHRPEETIILVPAVAFFESTEPRFFLEDPGRYWVRWRISFDDKGSENLEIDQTVKVTRAQPADLEFIARVGDPDFIRLLFGRDFFQQKTRALRERLFTPDAADFRATAVIAVLLEATRPDSPDEVVRERRRNGDLQVWAEEMWKVAEEFPESSYAPYSAYYAGCCYYALGVNRAIEAVRAKRVPGNRIDKIAEFEQRASLIKNDADCAKARAALTFAADHADDYLRPRAICMQASLRKWVGAFDEAEALLDKAAPLGGEGGTIHDLVEKMRKGLARVKERQLAGQQQRAGE